MPIELVIGAGNWGVADEDDMNKLIAAIRKHKSIIETVDTAALYPFSAPSASEMVVGGAGFAQDGFLVNTKALFYPEGGCYTHDGVQNSVMKSLKSLNVSKVSSLPHLVLILRSRNTSGQCSIRTCPR